MADHAGFQNFKQVKKHFPTRSRIFRSSAPHYETRDSDQRLDEESIKFLHKEGIIHVISLNSRARDQTIVNELHKAGIEYTPLPVDDWTAPSPAQFDQGHAAYERYPSGTLVWCGYGWGRTGTMITALQIMEEKKKQQPYHFTRADYDENKVEEDIQRDALNKLQEKK